MSQISPGDLIRWRYEAFADVTAELVSGVETLWSTVNCQWCFIGGNSVHMCLHVSNDQITWLNERGCFSATLSGMVTRLYDGRHYAIAVVERYE